MELLCKPWCWTMQHKPTEDWAIVRTVRMCSLRVWYKKLRMNPLWKRFVHKFHSNKTPKNPTIMIFDQPGQQLISTSICPAASLPCHLWTACLVHCGRALVLLVIQQWRLHFGWLSPLSAILKLELNWSTDFSLDIYYVHICTHQIY